MKASILGKIFSIFMFILLSQTSLFGSTKNTVDHYFLENKVELDKALDAALVAYSAAKSKLNDIEAYNGTDPQKLALRNQAKSLQTQLKEKYDATSNTAIASVKETYAYTWNFFTDEHTWTYTYDLQKIKKTEELSKEVVDLGSQVSVLYCQFNGGTWANGVCTQSGDDDNDDNDDSNDSETTASVQQTFNDNVQSILTTIHQNSTVSVCHVYGAFGECLY